MFQVGAEVNHKDWGGHVRELVAVGGKEVEPMGASLKYTVGCAGGQMCRNVGELIYQTAYRHNMKTSCSKQWTDKRKNYSLWHHGTHHSVSHQSPGTLPGVPAAVLKVPC